MCEKYMLCFMAFDILSTFCLQYSFLVNFYHFDRGDSTKLIPLFTPTITSEIIRTFFPSEVSLLLTLSSLDSSAGDTTSSRYGPACFKKNKYLLFVSKNLNNNYNF